MKAITVAALVVIIGFGFVGSAYGGRSCVTIGQITTCTDDGKPISTCVKIGQITNCN